MVINFRFLIFPVKQWIAFYKRNKTELSLVFIALLALGKFLLCLSCYQKDYFFMQFYLPQKLINYIFFLVFMFFFFFIFMFVLLTHKKASEALFLMQLISN